MATEYLVEFAKRGNITPLLTFHETLMLFVISAYPDWNRVYNEFDEDAIEDAEARVITQAASEVREYSNWTLSVKELLKHVGGSKLQPIIDLLRKPLDRELDWGKNNLFIMCLYMNLYLPESQMEEFSDKLEDKKPFTHFETPDKLEAYKEENPRISQTFLRILIQNIK